MTRMYYFNKQSYIYITNEEFACCKMY